MNITTTTGISATEFTLPAGQELPEGNWETKIDALDEMLLEIDSVMNKVSWGTFGQNHTEWYNAWSDEFRRIRREMGAFDPFKF